MVNTVGTDLAVVGEAGAVDGIDEDTVVVRADDRSGVVDVADAGGVDQDALVRIGIDVRAFADVYRLLAKEAVQVDAVVARRGVHRGTAVDDDGEVVDGVIDG